MASPSFFGLVLGLFVSRDHAHMLFGILLTAQVLICAVMGGLILIQRSEGGALGMGGGPSGFMSARGAGNLLTKLTWVFAALLFANSLGMTVVGNLDARGASVVDQVDPSKLPTAPLSPARAPAAAATSSAPSLNDLPVASTPGAQQAPATNNLSTLPLGTPSTAPILPSAPQAQASSSVAPPKMPKPLAIPAPTHTTTHLPAALGNASVSLAPLGAKTSSHSAAAPSVFPSSSSSASKPVISAVAPSSSASTTPSSAPASTPASSQ